MLYIIYLYICYHTHTDIYMKSYLHLPPYCFHPPTCLSFTLVGLLICPQTVPLLLSRYIYIYLDLDFPYERKLH